MIMGLGVYPCGDRENYGAAYPVTDGDCKCFDPDRPSWLPYWIDTVGENLCKYGFDFIPGVIASSEPVPPAPVVPHPNAPSTEHEMTTPGAWRPIDSAPTNEDWVRLNQRNLANFNPNEKDYSGWLLLGAAGIGLLLVITAVKK